MFRPLPLNSCRRLIALASAADTAPLASARARRLFAAAVAIAILILVIAQAAAEVMPLPATERHSWQANPMARNAAETGVFLPPPQLPSDNGADEWIQPTPPGLPASASSAVASACAQCVDGAELWDWQLLPDGLIYRSYLAGFKEPRMHSLWAYEDELGAVWDIALGGRVGLVRYGSHDNVMPDGWQLDLEGAAFPRLDPSEDRDLVSVDFRAGVPLTYGAGPYRTKFAYYHLSSHLGDEFLLKNPTVVRYNYSRDVLVLGQSYYLNDDWRVYGEAGWAFYSDVSGEWEFQFGVDYSPLAATGFRGAPFAAANAHLREEVDFGGNLVAQLGWQWRQAASGHLFRVGVEYYNGKSDQFEFFDRYENKVGLAIWYDY